MERAAAKDIVIDYNLFFLKGISFSFTRLEGE